MAMEIERKYLIERPEDTVLARHSVERWEIMQVYLCSQPGVTARVRQVTEGEKTRYYYTEKRRISDLTAEEHEREISDLEYMSLFQRADTTLKPIRKCRWRMPYMGRVLEVDVYPFWKKTAVLEVEFTSESDVADIPEWINVLKDVTGDVRFKNVCLACEVPQEESLLCE